MTANIALALAIIIVLFPLALFGLPDLAGVVLVHEAAELYSSLTESVQPDAQPHIDSSRPLWPSNPSRCSPNTADTGEPLRR